MKRTGRSIRSSLDICMVGRHRVRDRAVDSSRWLHKGSTSCCTSSPTCRRYAAARMLLGGKTCIGRCEHGKFGPYTSYRAVVICSPRTNRDELYKSQSFMPWPSHLGLSAEVTGEPCKLFRRGIYRSSILAFGEQSGEMSESIDKDRDADRVVCALTTAFA